ncbi:MAG: signal peptidase I [Chloroflexi bacterium]|nr:signal peptidase I [Chloroflexota bacterium]
MQYQPDDIPPIDVNADYYADIPIELPPPRWLRIKRFLVELIETIVIALVLFMIIETVSARIKVDGQSMEPTFSNGNFVIVNKLAYRFGELQRGDVIVFPSPDNFQQGCPWNLLRTLKGLVGIPQELFCPVRLIKRVIGLSGDQIRISNGQIFVNDKLISEPYVSAPPRGNPIEVTVPAGALYVMGDNRNNSSDSRSWGPLEIDHVLGKAVFVYWPFGDFRLVENFENVFIAP